MNGLPFGEKISASLGDAVGALGLELCHVDWKPGRSRGVLTLFIDRDGGVTLEDCERASHTASALLDAVPELDAPYSLEVSSPGLDRPLWTLQDCARFEG